MAVEWRKDCMGGWITVDGRWRLRVAPSFRLPCWWLYGPRPRLTVSASRYTPTGRYEDAVSFLSVKAGKEFVKNLEK